MAGEDTKIIKSPKQSSLIASCQGSPALLNIYLYVLSVLMLSLIFPLLVFQPFLFSLYEVFIIASIRLQTLRMQVNNVGGHGVQEIAVMRHNQDSGLPGLRVERMFQHTLESQQLDMKSPLNNKGHSNCLFAPISSIFCIKMHLKE